MASFPLLPVRLIAFIYELGCRSGEECSRRVFCVVKRATIVQCACPFPVKLTVGCQEEFLIPGFKNAAIWLCKLNTREAQIEAHRRSASSLDSGCLVNPHKPWPRRRFPIRAVLWGPGGVPRESGAEDQRKEQRIESHSTGPGEIRYTAVMDTPRGGVFRRRP